MKFPIAKYSRFISYCVKSLKMTKKEAKEAWENCVIQHSIPHAVDMQEKSQSVLHMFVWAETAQGQEYWHTIYKRNYPPI